ncbi:hypothetical protein RX327_33280 [Bradyrhizobium sp. BEA-2-5]|nr:hypothetical protein [Bradyrhizobium sp. BEA-2-5]WOH80588.1 hypothetical protein RX327_33280 [Bradyrhizobium sp. BEA-2-5]
MKLVRDETATSPQRYVCPDSEDDPLHDPVARKWIESSLKPPAN